MRSARAHVYSKKSGTLFTIVLAALAMGGMVGHPEVRVGMAVPVVLCVVMVVACLVGVAVTPDRLDFASGMRRAARLGADGAQPWEDCASNRLAVGVLAMLTAAAGGLTAMLVVRDMTDGVILASCAAAATVAVFGWALQYFALAFGRRAMPWFMLFLFCTWVMPLLIGGLLGLTTNADLGTLVTRLCPIAAVGSPNAVSLGFIGVLAAVFLLKTVTIEKAKRVQLG